MPVMPNPTYTIRIPISLREKLAERAAKVGISPAKFVADAMTSAVESAEEAPVGVRLSRVATRLENLFALVRSIEDDEQERRRRERAAFIEAMAQNYAQVAEAVAGNAIVIEALAAEVVAVKSTVERLADRVDQQTLILAALLSSGDAKGARRAYAEIYKGVVGDGKKVGDYLAAAINRGRSGE